MKNYNPLKIEKKWQKEWQKKKTFELNCKKAKKPYYNLMMFPYPSAEGLHVGNTYAFTGADVHGRFYRLKGFDVFEPIGFDAFGIHSENFAIKKRMHPKVLVRKNVNNFRNQLKSLGCLFDWRYELNTTDPGYYKWTQWLFLEFFKAGLAYRKKAPVDWCPSCKTVLADEQVISGKCERCDSEVIQKETNQWFFKITNYAEKLLSNLDSLPQGALGRKIRIEKKAMEKGIDWSLKTKAAQRNWIGKKEGALLSFSIFDSESSIEVFTTRPDTIFGATYLVVAPEHFIIKKLKSKIKNQQEVETYLEKAKKKTELERTDFAKNKTGVKLEGIEAINPANKEKIPVFAADYVLSSYGTGAIMAVPAHDQRDFDFAKKYNLPVKIVVSSFQSNQDKTEYPLLKEAYEGEGYLINSGKFNGMKSEKARREIMKFVNAKKTINYHLRDWLISRQRYWGPPIPVIYCKDCGIVPVSQKKLPVLLPYVKNFRPKGTGKSPLASIKKFVNTKCPKCGKPAKRETDVSDTFFDSSWYFFRYLSPKLKNKPFDKNLVKKWLPVDMYIGGQEHAVLHLLYTRFITMVLKDLGYIDFEEPFKKFRAHGLITKDGAKMSKSKGNVVNPDSYYKKYGADTLRTYLMFIGPFSEGGDWQDKGIVGIKRFIEKVYNLRLKVLKTKNKKTKEINKDLEKLIQQTIKKVTDDLENLKYNTAISALMILTGEMAKEKKIFPKDYKQLLILLSPFAPYVTEELWSQMKFKGSVHCQKWPNYDQKLIKEEKITLVIQVNGKIRDKIETGLNISEKEAKEVALKREKVKKWIVGKKIKKIIFIKDKLINFVI